ncbi:MAG: hypothetical protein FWC01_03560 [Treponema sp.]|nr:hypothetical protein [Treponema sp.]MCL2237591.1 hypothetical protein [Treponema sp.]
MKKFNRIICIFAVIFTLGAGNAFSQFDNITDAVGSFSQAMVNSLPFNSTIGLNWSDAHIGKFFPSLPPHFGVGLTVGATSIPVASINELVDTISTLTDVSINLPAEISLGFPMLAYAAEARIGGFFLPFDIGVKAGYLPKVDLLTDLTGFGMNYLLLGADFRYQVVDLKLMKISVGVGYNRLEGGISQNLGNGIELAFGDYALAATAPELGLKWETNMLEFKAQISFPIVVVTPYAGIGIGYAWSKAGYGLTSDITATHNGQPLPISDVTNALSGYGISGLTDRGFEQMFDSEGFNFRLFGGLAVNLPFVKFDLTVMYNLMDTIFTETFNLSSLGVTFGVRLQI